MNPLLTLCSPNSPHSPHSPHTHHNHHSTHHAITTTLTTVTTTLTTVTTVTTVTTRHTYHTCLAATAHATTPLVQTYSPRASSTSAPMRRPPRTAAIDKDMIKAAMRMSAVGRPQRRTHGFSVPHAFSALGNGERQRGNHAARPADGAAVCRGT
jgi:hypothetical protein